MPDIADFFRLLVSICIPKALQAQMKTVFKITFQRWDGSGSQIIYLIIYRSYFHFLLDLSSQAIYRVLSIKSIACGVCLGNSKKRKE